MTSQTPFIIKEIKATETYVVRHPELRAGRPLSSCAFEGDDLETTIHLGIYDEDKLVGVATFLKHQNDKLKAHDPYQLRGMAILKSYQKKGLGKKLLEFGEALLPSKKADVIWCNAREVATNFYIKNGYQIIGEAFDIPKIGLHFTMYKTL